MIDTPGSPIDTVETFMAAVAKQDFDTRRASRCSDTRSAKPTKTCRR